MKTLSYLCVFSRVRDRSFPTDQPKLVTPRCPVRISRNPLDYAPEIGERERVASENKTNYRKKHCDMEYAELIATNFQTKLKQMMPLYGGYVFFVCECVFGSKSNGECFARKTKRQCKYGEQQITSVPKHERT